MDSNKNNTTSNSTGADHFFPTSTTSPHFFDPLDLPTFLDSPNYPLTSATSWPPPVEQTNYPTTNIAAASSGPTTTTTRQSKKRSRASRRAPTTVLTTDTSNFRAMVQEFTGIPAPPFTSPGTSTATPLHFPRSLINNPPPSFLFKPGGFLPDNKLFHSPTASASASDLPISFQSLLHSQVLNLPQPPAAPVVVSSSGSELSLPGVIGLETRFRQQQQQQMDPTGTGSCSNLNFSGSGSTVAAPHVFRAEKGSSEGRGGDGLLESWVCSSD